MKIVAQLINLFGKIKQACTHIIDSNIPLCLAQEAIMFDQCRDS
jgi:hypothetical protein